MIDINLFKNYKLSLADVHRAYIEEHKVLVKEVKVYTNQNSLFKKFVLTFLTATVLFGLIAAAVIIIFNPFSKPPPPLAPRPETPIEEVVEVEPESEYVMIQIIEFADTVIASPSGISQPTRNLTPDIEVLPKLTQETVAKPETNMPIPQNQPSRQETVAVTTPPPARTDRKPAVTTPSPPVTQPAFSATPLYSLRLDNATPAEYEILNNLTAGYDKVTVQTESRYRFTPVWRVYLPKSGSGIFIRGTEVAYESSFPTQAEAVLFAQKYNDTVIINMENENDISYMVKVCCMSSEDAKVYAQKSGITDKIFLLKKE